MKTLSFEDIVEGAVAWRGVVLAIEAVYLVASHPAGPMGVTQ